LGAVNLSLIYFIWGGAMFSFWKKIVLCSIAVMFLSSCAKIPEEIVSPAFSFKPAGSDEPGVVSINFTGGLKNANDSTVFLNVKGEVAVMDNAKNILLKIPFSLPSILPFETGIIQTEISIKSEEAIPLFFEFGIDADNFFASREPQNFLPDDEKVVLKNFSLEKKGIVEILEGKEK